MSEDITLTRKSFSNEEVEVIRRTIARDCDDQQLRLFLHVAISRGLDPFANQIHAVVRGGKLCIQPGIDGLRALAEETKEYRPGKQATFEMDGDRIVACTAYVMRKYGEDWVEFSDTAFMDEYYPQQNDFLWKKMPRVMLAKCAEARVLRRTFPTRLGGFYDSAELAQSASMQIPPARVVQSLQQNGHDHPNAPRSNGAANGHTTKSNEPYHPNAPKTNGHSNGTNTIKSNQNTGVYTTKIERVEWKETKNGDPYWTIYCGDCYFTTWEKSVSDMAKAVQGTPEVVKIVWYRSGKYLNTKNIKRGE